MAASSAGQGRSPARILSLSPNVTEILYGIGAFDRVVAVSKYCDYPKEVENLPRVGAWMNTNFEQIAGLEPDLVIMTDAQTSFLQEQLETLGLSTLVVPGQSLADVFGAIEKVGTAVDMESEARKLASDLRAVLDDVQARTSNRPRPRVLLVVDRLPGVLRDIYVATKGSYLAEIVTIAGGEPITPPATFPYAKMTTEAIVSLDPDVIIDIVQAVGNPAAVLVESEMLREDSVSVWNELEQVRAVRDHRVYPIRDQSVVHPSQFVGKTAQRIGRLLHPEAFQE
jgi:iron complex transport system substrate-binding protein